MNAKDLLYFILGQSYTCSICHQVIYPIITEINVSPISISLSQDKTQSRGGIGDKLLQDNICVQCSNALKN